MPPAETSAFFPIRVVSNETGVNAITLRAWERRYGLLTPKRTEKGHRLYTEQDIALIKKVVTLLDRGIPISQAKAIIDSGADQTSRSGQNGEPSQWHQYLEQLSQATESFDSAQLQSTLDEVSQFFPTDIAFRFLLVPFYERLCKRPESPLNTAQLSFFAGALKGRLCSLLYQPHEKASLPSLVMADMSASADPALLLTGVLLQPMGIQGIWLAGCSEVKTLSSLLNEERWQAALLQLPAHPDEDQLNALQQMASETGKLLFCNGHDSSVADRLRQHGMIPLSGDLQKDALTIRDVVTHINE